MHSARFFELDSTTSSLSAPFIVISQFVYYLRLITFGKKWIDIKKLKNEKILLFKTTLM